MRRHLSHLIHRVYCIFWLGVSSLRFFINLVIIFLLHINLLNIILLNFHNLIINQSLSYQCWIPFSNRLTPLSSVLLTRNIQRLNIHLSLLLIYLIIEVFYDESARMLPFIWYLHKLNILIVFPILIGVQLLTRCILPVDFRSESQLVEVWEVENVSSLLVYCPIFLNLVKWL